ncbi:putative transcriptional regulatory protein [Purpureocillium lavendulum]|uniref:Transcriptional regulatory protein n=1 Tax=Purpureocillium lavendulum TaxID=1247861 RepID=A0AB34FAS8_9HYPO|nr:putative transcriptional regulatory protein [Purpureocillium lavendulum]
MVEDQDGPRFMDSHIWANIYDELQGMRDIIEAEDVQHVSVFNCEDNIHDGSADLLLCGDDPSINMANLQPEPVHVFRLWQLFLDRVNPLTKVIHVPTVQPYVIEATTSISSVALQHQALLFSKYTMAIVSLSDHECAAMFNTSRNMALQRFTLGTKLSLIRLNFLKNYDMAALQALILFLSPDGNYNTDRIQATLTKFRGAAVKLDRALRDLEERYPDVDAGNTHVAALTVRPMLMKKIYGMVPIQEQSDFGSQIFSPEDNVFRTLLSSLEHGCEAYEEMAACRFEWTMRMHFRFDILAAFTGQLRYRPSGPLSDRGWEVIEKDFSQRDPPLTSLGTIQASSLAKTFPILAGFSHIIAPDGIGNRDIDSSGTVIIDPDLQESSDLPCDTGSDRATLEQAFPHLDFSAFDDN